MSICRACQGRPLEVALTSETLPLDKLQQQVAILFYERVLLFEGASRIHDFRDLVWVNERHSP
jgi:hypothetical protein